MRYYAVVLYTQERDDKFFYSTDKRLVDEVKKDCDIWFAKTFSKQLEEEEKGIDAYYRGYSVQYGTTPVFSFEAVKDKKSDWSYCKIYGIDPDSENLTGNFWGTIDPHYPEVFRASIDFGPLETIEENWREEMALRLEYKGIKDIDPDIISINLLHDLLKDDAFDLTDDIITFPVFPAEDYDFQYTDYGKIRTINTYLDSKCRWDIPKELDDLLIMLIRDLAENCGIDDEIEYDEEQ